MGLEPGSEPAQALGPAYFAGSLRDCMAGPWSISQDGADPSGVTLRVVTCFLAQSSRFLPEPEIVGGLKSCFLLPRPK